MIPDVNLSLVAAAYVAGEVAEDFGASQKAKLAVQLVGGLVAAAVVYLAPALPWLMQIGEAGLAAGLVASGLVHAPALLNRAKALTPFAAGPSETGVSAPAAPSDVPAAPSATAQIAAAADPATPPAA